MTNVKRFTEAELIRLVGSAVSKIDLMGTRGTTLCSTDEVEALAVWVVLSSTLPGHPSDPQRQPYYVEKDGPIS